MSGSEELSGFQAFVIHRSTVSVLRTWEPHCYSEKVGRPGIVIKGPEL